MKPQRPKLIYSESFKRSVVDDIESGIMTANQAAKYYGLGGGGTVYNWLATYGMNAAKGRKVIIMSPKEDTELMTLRKEMALLKKQLEETEIRAIAWESMVEAIEEDLGIPVKKKPWSQALIDAKKKLYPGDLDSVPSGSAESSGSANKPDISVSKPLKRR